MQRQARAAIDDGALLHTPKSSYGDAVGLAKARLITSGAVAQPSRRAEHATGQKTDRSLGWIVA